MVSIKCLPVDREDDGKWPKKNKDGRQELEIKIGTEHIVFEVQTFLFCNRTYTNASRLPKSVPLSMLLILKTLKDFESSTTSSKISKPWYSL